MAPPSPIRSQTEFIERYRYLCRHIARNFVLKARKKDDGEAIWSEAEIEDLTSAAVLKLCRAPKKYWNQPPYAKRIIVNAIIDEFNGKRKTSTHEVCPVSHDFFDSIPGRNGLSHAVELAFDSERALSAFECLSASEKMVLEFYFGLNGIQPIKHRAIAIRLGRTEPWVEYKLQSGLEKLRAEI